MRTKGIENTKALKQEWDVWGQTGFSGEIQYCKRATGNAIVKAEEIKVQFQKHTHSFVNIYMNICLGLC